jgi:uncharacterized protein (UPF0333 family)
MIGGSMWKPLRKFLRDKRGSVSLDYIIAVGIIVSVLVYVIGEGVNVVQTTSSQMQGETLAMQADQFSRILLEDPGAPPNWSSIKQPGRPGLGIYNRYLYNYTNGEGYLILDENKTMRLSPYGKLYIPYTVGDPDYDAAYHIISPKLYNMRGALGLNGSGYNFHIVIRPVFQVTLSVANQTGYVDSSHLAITVTVAGWSGNLISGATVYVRIIRCDGSVFNPSVSGNSTQSNGQLSFTTTISGTANGRYAILVLASKKGFYGWATTFFTYSGGSTTWISKYKVRPIFYRNTYLKMIANVTVGKNGASANPTNVIISYFLPDGSFQQSSSSSVNSTISLSAPLNGPYPSVVLAYGTTTFGYAVSSYPMMVDYGSRLVPQSNYLLVIRMAVIEGSIYEVLIYFWR